MQKIEWQFTTIRGFVITQFRNPDVLIVTDPSNQWAPPEYKNMAIIDLVEEIVARDAVIDAFTESQKPAGPDYSVSHPADGT